VVYNTVAAQLQMHLMKLCVLAGKHAFFMLDAVMCHRT
jgi:hypothetical protein